MHNKLRLCSMSYAKIILKFPQVLCVSVLLLVAFNEVESGKKQRLPYAFQLILCIKNEFVNTFTKLLLLKNSILFCLLFNNNNNSNDRKG